MALVSIFTEDPAQRSPDQERHYEAVYRSRRGHDPRVKYWWALGGPPDRTAPVATNADSEDPAPSQTLALEPVPEEKPAPPRRRHRKPVVSPERRLSLEEMARALTGRVRS